MFTIERLIHPLRTLCDWPAVIASVCLALPLTTVAATFDAGTLIVGTPYSFDSGSTGIGSGLAAPGLAFNDSVGFTLSVTQGLNSSISFTNITGEALISDFAVTLFRNDNPSALIHGVNGTSGDLVTNTFAGGALSAGAYTLVISGKGSGLSGGTYLGIITAVPALPVPEIPSWLSLVVGLGMIATLVHRRSRHAQPTASPDT